jgi:hypothetical protein
VPGDNVVSIIGGHRARLVRLNVLEPHVSNGSVVLAMAEMQVWSDGKNIAPGSDITASDSTEAEGWSQNALVDGFASGADILDWPAWLAGLSQRREVEHQLAMLEAKRVSLTQHWQRLGLGLIIAIAVLGIIAALIWLQRQRRARLMEMERLRQRIAQDLHDEIGSSLGSIALIAQDILADDKHAREDLAEIKTIADETVDAMRDITRLMQSERYGTDDLPTLLRETAARTLRGIKHTVSIDNETQTRRLAVDRQRDLMLMFKERCTTSRATPKPPRSRSRSRKTTATSSSPCATTATASTPPPRPPAWASPISAAVPPSIKAAPTSTPRRKAPL